MYSFSLSMDTVFDNFQASGPTYNVSSNQVVRVESTTGLNSHWVGHWITTTDHLHFFLIIFTNVVGSGGANGCLVYSWETGSSSSSFITDTPTTIGQDRLKIQFGKQYELQSLTDDNISAISVVANYTESNFSLNTTFQPRGSLLFNGGSGSFFWGSDFNQGWASPAAYTSEYSLSTEQPIPLIQNAQQHGMIANGVIQLQHKAGTGSRFSSTTEFASPHGLFQPIKAQPSRHSPQLCIQMAGKKWLA